MRQWNDLKFSSFFDDISENYREDTVDLSRLNHTQSVQQLIDFVFPPAVVADPTMCISQAVLSPFSAFANNFNSNILHNVPGPIHRYHSSDLVEGDGENSSEMVLVDTEFLNSLDELGIPSHELILKIGAICRLTQNFNALCGLRTNMRVIVQIFRYCTISFKSAVTRHAPPC
jgi:hypothetical protein